MQHLKMMTIHNTFKMGARFLLVAVLQLMICTTALAEDNPANPGTETSRGQDGFFEIVFSGGVTGFLIVMLLLGLSITLVALIVEHLLSLRRHHLLPAGLAEDVQRCLVAGDVPGATAACNAKPSFLGFVLQAGIMETESGWNAVEKAMEDAAAEQAAKLLRKIDYLSVIANIAPMVGLLGTVFGMIFAFQEVASTEGSARAADLATGIYQALVTTVGGLLVAIPALAAFAIFRNHIDQMVADGSHLAQQVFLPLKRRRNQRKQATGTTSQSPPPSTQK